jgi:hypothetical protein
MPRTHATVAISLHPELRAQAQRRADGLGFRNSFSAYVAKLIADDLQKHDAAGESSPPYKVASASSQQAAQIVQRAEQRVRDTASGTAPAPAGRKRKDWPK